MANVDITAEKKAGFNRGKRRIWLEGKNLVASGFNIGKRISVTFGENLITIKLDEEGKRKVSGKIKADGTENPIIDLNGLDIAASLGTSERESVNYRNGIITIRPIF